jgi:KUP system potassium uptake protein
LYALQEAFNGSHGVAPTPANIIGIVSLFLWSLIVMVSLKYVLVLMRASNHGEGGILALLALVRGERSDGDKGWTRIWIVLALIGAAMLYGDGVITPAISVLSAIEGLQVAIPTFEPYVVTLTVLILTGLFAIQPVGSGRVGVLFGPILATWFAVIAILGVNSLIQHPAILVAINPMYSIDLFARNGMQGFVTLGAVVLCLTGGEALYADMGHFGRLPIRVAWYGLALPALVLNYLGQGALLLSDPAVAARPFYSMVPEWALYLMVVLATLSTIVASQALISAVFSLTHQAAQLGFSPRVHIVHTSGAAVGQIYLPALNWLLMAATIAVVAMFGSSSRLAAAFGLAVSTTMAITTMLFAVLACTRWQWSLFSVVAVAGSFLTVDLAFVGANTLKFVDGGWLPLILGFIVFMLMSTWYLGRSLLAVARQSRSISLEMFLDSLALSPPYRVAGTAVFFTEQPTGVPLVLLHHLKHNQVLHERVILLTLIIDKVPRVPDDHRVQIEKYAQNFVRIVAHYGFMEEPNIPQVLEIASQFGSGCPYNDIDTTFYLGNDTVIVPAKKYKGVFWLLRIFILLRRNECSATLHFGIPPNRVVELGARIEL